MIQQDVHGGLIAGMLTGNAAMQPDSPALLEGDNVVRHGELPQRVACLAAHLRTCGVAPGDRVGLLLYDGIAFVEWLFAAARIGATAVLLNWRLAAPEIAGIVARTTPKVILHSDSLASLVAGCGATLLVALADTTASGDRHDSLATTGDPHEALPGSGNAAPFYIMFTSGTTGISKGAMHGQANALAGALSYAQHRGLGPDDRLLSTNPLFHVAGLQLALAALVSVGSIRFVPRGTDADGLLDLMRGGCTHGMLNPNVLDALRLTGSDPGGLALRSFAGAAGAGAQGQYRSLRETFGFETYGGYGQTEVGGWATGIGIDAMFEQPTTLGFPLPLVATAVLDDHGHPLSDPLAEGELGLRAPSVMLGYWQDDAATEATIGTGWLRTGDLVRRDERGLVHMLGRSKELIKTGGENVYPLEVETVLREHPAIADVAVAGVPHRKWSEAVKAFVVLKPGMTITGEEIAALCKGRIAGYKRPIYLEAIDAIPRDPLGKVQRRVLSAMPISEDQAI